MSDDRFQPDLTNVTLPDISRPYLPLPIWIARRILRPNETITWVCGPRFNPAWERYVTHPALFLVALALGTALVAIGRLCSESWTVMPPLAVAAVMAGPALVLGSVFVLGISAAYFTRLVVTNYQLVIVQGYEVCRSWSLHELPPSLVRYGPRRIGEAERHVDLDALQTMLGNATDRFADSKTIIAFGKHLDRIKAEKGRPS
jgi:hypothetical protein